MLEIMEKYINKLGDFNHAFIGLSVQIAISMICPNLLHYTATSVSFLYLGKEHQTYIRLGNLKSFNFMLWQPHDRRQTIYLWIAVWGYPFIFNNFLPQLIKG